MVPIPTPYVLAIILTPGTLNLVILESPKVISLLIVIELGSASFPITIFLSPVKVLESAAAIPTTVLKLPVASLNASWPIATLPPLVSTFSPA